MKIIKKDKKDKNELLLMLLKESDKITLDDLNFDNILKEQGNILSNINEILDSDIFNKNIPNKEIPSKENPSKDNKFKNMISEYKLIKTQKKNKIKNKTTEKKTKYNHPESFEYTNIKPKNLKQTKLYAKSNQKPKNISIHKLSSKKIYKYYNKRKYDITIDKPNIYVKDVPSIKNMKIIQDKPNKP